MKNDCAEYCAACVHESVYFGRVFVCAYVKFGCKVMYGGQTHTLTYTWKAGRQSQRRLGSQIERARNFVGSESIDGGD